MNVSIIIPAYNEELALTALINGIRQHVPDAEIIVDGLLGTGASGEPRGLVADAIQFIDAQTDRALIVAIDVPSALNGRTRTSRICVGS